ncbi:component of anaerobic dehydrogenase [Beggiatoa sp. PS]|nr:component of anaerobic dehydrogenase [Beggiatoa sp. PS]
MRPQLYMLASGLFNQPTKERLEALPGLIAQLQLAMPDAPWADTLNALEAEMVYEKTKEIEYSRLFILDARSVPAQPFGSYWLESDQCLLGKTTMEVKEMMAQHGIEVADNAGLLPDHIVSELEFMAYLASQDETLETQNRLLEQHLAKWVPQFIAAIQAANPMTYYRLATDFLEKFLTWDQEQLQ